jgi:hypothetical protein
VSARAVARILSSLLEVDEEGFADVYQPPAMSLMLPEEEDRVKEVMGEPSFHWIQQGVRVIAPHLMGGESVGTVEEIYASRKDYRKGTVKVRFDSDPDFLSTVQFRYLKPIVPEGS